MQSFQDRASIEAALHLPLDPRLHRLLTERVGQCRATGLLDLTHFLVVEPGDTEQAIAEEVGFSPLVNPTDGARFGAAGFHPFWDWLQRHDGWFELIVTVGNSGFAFVLLIQDVEKVDKGLQSLCRMYASAVWAKPKSCATTTRPGNSPNV